jgi:hypothetical protein
MCVPVCMSYDVAVQCEAEQLTAVTLEVNF